mmetsp:Transcript_122352/g.357150  ORF Transcript_122352/g.357150 Transcript_122352/m.357150 type:complete len:470 (-) Transcript_122352:461-1870(-)
MEEHERNVLHHCDGIGTNHWPEVVVGVPVLIDLAGRANEDGHHQAADGLHAHREDACQHAVLRPAWGIALLLRDLEGAEPAGHEEHTEQRRKANTDASSHHGVLHDGVLFLGEILDGKDQSLPSHRAKEHQFKHKQAPHRGGERRFVALVVLHGVAAEHDGEERQVRGQRASVLHRVRRDALAVEGEVAVVGPGPLSSHANGQRGGHLHGHDSGDGEEAGLHPDRGHAVGWVQLQRAHAGHQEEDGEHGRLARYGAHGQGGVQHLGLVLGLGHHARGPEEEVDQEVHAAQEHRAHHGGRDLGGLGWEGENAQNYSRQAAVDADHAQTLDGQEAWPRGVEALAEPHAPERGVRVVLVAREGGEALGVLRGLRCSCRIRVRQLVVLGNLHHLLSLCWSRGDLRPNLRSRLVLGGGRQQQDNEELEDHTASGRVHAALDPLGRLAQALGRCEHVHAATHEEHAEHRGQRCSS